MCRLIGMVLIFCGCIGFGGSKTAEEKERIWHLREMIRIIRRIQDEMRYGKRTLPEICAILSAGGKEPYRTCFAQIYEQMNRRSGMNIESIWEKQMEACFFGVSLQEEEKDVLKKLPQSLGMQDETLQAANVGQSLALLEKRLGRAEETYGDRRKMILSVSALTGAFIVLLLL